MLTSEFDYELPESRIAQFPAPKGHSRLLLLTATGAHSHHHVADLPRLLRAGDLLVVNNTEVLPARLIARRAETGGRLELLLVEPCSPTEWIVLAKPGSRARPGARFALGENLSVEILDRHLEDRFRVRFSEPVEPHLRRFGHVPLPPYIRRPDRESDRADYQTIFARSPGAIAAPTAGLHFSVELLERLARSDIEVAEITLHVGLGTFRPVSTTRIEQHRIESERYEISTAAAECIERTRRRGGRLVAVGTTVVRTLEAVAADRRGAIVASAGSTDLFIKPGFRFQVVDLLLTNFHLPRSTLLMLVCAFGRRVSVLAAYREALRRGYRFYSYGDAMLLERAR